MVAPPTKRIGELLLERRLITQRQLDDALLQQRTTKAFLGEILVSVGAITPEALLEALSEHFHIPRESLDPQRIDWTVTKPFPASILLSGRCFPIRADATSVTVAIVNPLDAGALSEIERLVGVRRIKPVLVMARDLQAVVQAYKHQTLRAIQERLAGHGHQ